MREFKKVGVPYEELRNGASNPNSKAEPSQAEKPAPVAEKEEKPKVRKSAPPAEDMTEKNSGTEAETILTQFQISLPDSTKIKCSALKVLVDAYGPRDGGVLFLRDALADWLKSYNSETIIHPKVDYPTSERFRTSRRFSAELISDIRKRVDPLNRRADGWIGQRIAISAITQYLTKG